MNDDDECIHGLGPVSACVICNGRAKKEAEEPQVHVFVTKFHGRICSVCRRIIGYGSSVAWSEGASPIHEECQQ